MALWSQHEFKLKRAARGCHLVTDQVLKQISDPLRSYNVGLCNIYLKHTSASLTICENADSDVRKDMETFLNRTVPEGPKAPWVHTAEGDDDMPAHVKSCMFGVSLSIPISRGKLNMGMWQGIWLCEHRDSVSPREVVVTLQGQ